MDALKCELKFVLKSLMEMVLHLFLLKGLLQSIKEHENAWYEPPLIVIISVPIAYGILVLVVLVSPILIPYATYRNIQDRPERMMRALKGEDHGRVE